MPTNRAPWIVSLVALIGLVVSVTTLWPRSGPDVPVGDPGPGPGLATEKASATTAPDRGPGVGRSDAGAGAGARLGPGPAQLSIRAIDLDARVTPVGVTPDGQMQLPAQPWVLGWYQFGPPPGSAAGSAVLAGHLDSTEFGLGPLVGLRDLEPGDAVEVTLATGRTASYTVTALRRFDRQALPEQLFSRTGPPRLRIITCGGSYDRGAGGYQQNLVVTAVPA